SKRMIINIRHGKGNKDRIVRLSENVLELTREYFKIYHPKFFYLKVKAEECILHRVYGKYSPELKPQPV
ncbi:MAG: hypothetical protein PF487_13715, partial [Bacteroidales bacterium]|nr:hypothetical protein [Bacteroidales bacterium]